MAWIIYDKFLEDQLDGSATNLDAAGDTLKVGLLNSTYTPAPTTDALYSVIDANEVTGTGYTAGGVTVTTPLITPSGGTITFDMDDVVYAQNAAGFTNARYAILHASVSSQVIAYADLTSDRSVVSGSLTLEINVAGVFTVT